MDHGRNERCNVRFPDLDARCKDRVSKATISTGGRKRRLGGGSGVVCEVD